MRVTSKSVRIGASPDTVWRALTEPALVKAWQFGSDLDTDWTPGSSIRFHSEWDGVLYEQWGTVIEFDPPRSLRYSLFAPRPDLEDLPENRFVMTYAVEPLLDGSVVTFTHQDPRPGAEVDGEADGETPVLEALRQVAEGL
jgi:uncharacterized protein YndB with AHSA1/START domain